MMRRVLFASQSGARRRAGWPGWLAGALLLALALSLVAGLGLAHAAPSVSNSSGGLTFTTPNYRGVIGGPPGTKVTIRGTSWNAYADVLLSLTEAPGNCRGAVLVNTYQTDGSGSFNARFNWPTAANVLAPYYACATQVGKGTAFSRNTFTVLSDSPASVSISPGSVSAGASVTVTGANWLPGPQTVSVVIVPCSTICEASPVAHMEVIAGADGTFSQSMTILATAFTGSYYVQATNTEVALSAVSAAPVQVAGRPAPTSIPSPGASPTPTHGRQGVNSTTPSQTRTDLKYALLAGGLGLLVLIVLLGGITFFIGRSRGAHLPTSPKAEKDEATAGASPEAGRRASWREVNRLSADSLERPQAPMLPAPRTAQEKTVVATDALARTDPSLPAISGSGDNYPWGQRARSQAPTLSATPPPAPDASETAPTSSRPGQSSRRGSAFGFVQRIDQPPQPSAAPPSAPHADPPKDE